MKIFKKNQIIILVIALMLVSAGYLNYTATEGDAVATSGEELQYAGIGDAKLVSSNNVIDGNEQVAVVPNEEKNEMKETAIVEDVAKEDNENRNNNTNSDKQNEVAIVTSSQTSKETKEYFSSSKLNRETMYSQMIESYQKIMENDSISETQKAIAQNEIQNINNIKNKIMICENLIKTKGIEDLVIFVNDKSISVVLRADTLEQEQIAQIQNIIAREMTVEINDIHISNK